MKQDSSYSFIHLYKFVAAMVIAMIFHFDDHFCTIVGLDNPFRGNMLTFYLSWHGWALTELFFMFSGILFIHVYLPKIISGAYTFNRFMKRRILRLFPMIVLSTVTLYIIELLLYRNDLKSWSGSLDIIPLLWNIFFGSGVVFNSGAYINEPVWYIGVLVLCYVIAYILAFIDRKYRSSSLFFIPVFAGLCIMYSGLQLPLLNFRVARGLVAFFLGCMLELFMVHYNSYFPNRKKRLIIAACLMLGFALLILRLHFAGFGTMSSEVLFYDFFVFLPVIFLSMVCRPLNRICSHPFIKVLGSLSYGIYLWNFVIYAEVYLIISLVDNGIARAQANIMMLWVIMCVMHLLVAYLAEKLVSYLQRI